MYKIPQEEYYKLYDSSVDEFIDYFYSKEELIKFIAKWYHVDSFNDDILFNSFLNRITCDINQLFDEKRFILYDNYNRIINIHDFEDEALEFYNKNKSKYNTLTWHDYYLRLRRYVKHKHNHSFYWKQKINYEYRKDPVPYIHKIRGGPLWSSPHTAKIMRMYLNPEYKEFNRGSKKEIPQWWDDRTRRVQKSWKEQSKARHQWQRGIK